MTSAISKAVCNIQSKWWCKSLSIFRDRVGYRIAVFGLAALLALQGHNRALALDGQRTLAQYVHTSWGAVEGYAGGTIYAIAQSRDGYLWLGTERGLVRFDGSKFTMIGTPFPGHRPTGAVRGLVEDAAGNLWIRPDGPRLLRYRDGVFEDAAEKFEISDVAFTAMSRGDDGNLLLWGPQYLTRRFQSGQFVPGSPQDKIEGIVVSMLESANGVRWLGTRDAGLYQLKDRLFSRVLPDPAVGSVNALAPAEHGGVWIGSDTGLHLWEQGASIPLQLPRRLRNAQIFALVRDHNHNLWVGAESGLYRIDRDRETVTGYYRNTDEARVTAIYEDKEGNLWFGGSQGVERLRDGMFTSFSSPQTSLKAMGGPVFVDDGGRTWFAPVSGGLYCLENGAVTRTAVPGLNNDVIYSIDGSKDELWLGRQQGGLTQLTKRNHEWTARTYTRKDGLAQNSVYTVKRARDGSVWAGTLSGGVSVLRHGQFKTYGANTGLQTNAVFCSLQAADGKMWFASPNGLVSFDGVHWTSYGSPEAKLTLNVRTVFEDAGRVLWIGTSHGLARLVQGRIEAPHNLPEMLDEEVVGIGQDSEGFLWIVSAQHVLQVDPAKLLSGTLNEHDVLSYGADDGLTETDGVRRDRSLVSDSSGRIWLSLAHSLAVADVSAAKGYGLPVRVRIDSISLEDGAVATKQGLDLPPEIRSITFRYSGTNLSFEHRTLFRYFLDGLDQTWSTDASSRQVIYTHLAPGHYTFRTVASNALGVWNGPEADIAFNVRPAYWQTWYFQVLCVLAAASLAIAVYRVRLIQVTEQLNKRYQDRLAERTRIAQDLHDTLLQGVISASMQLDVAQDRIPEDSPARPLLRRVLQLMRQVTEEGRAALRGLRAHDSSADLEAMFKGLGDESVHAPKAEFLVRVEGRVRPLQSALLDEVYRIGREAYINAAAHAQASRIEVILESGLRAFRLVVRDDGRGIDAAILRDGRSGHWGLPGMKERARAIGSVLKIRSRVPGGTEVELVIPAAIAYTRMNAGRILWPWSLRRHYPEPREEE
jgi:ligand-binding sensor domain-containing protein/signal transduction histidine kinase